MAKEYLFTVNEVREMWKRPYERQINIINSKILEAFQKTDGNIAVSFSGGADSGMMLWLVSQLWANVYGYTRPLVVIFSNTANEFFGMQKHVADFVKLCEKTFDITIKLEIACGGKSYKSVVTSVGFPIASKKIARMVSDVRKALATLNYTYTDIEPYVKLYDIECADKLRKMGFGHTVVCDLTGIKSNNQKGTCYIPRRWLPLIPALFNSSPFCCYHLKKLPIKEVEKRLGGLQPMIGEMADDSKTRLNAYRRTGCNLFDSSGHGVSKPLGAVTGKTVRRWYYENPQVPLFKVYGKVVKDGEDYKYTGEQRTGCKLCMFGIMFDWERFDRLAEIEPQTVLDAFKPTEEGGLGYKDICEYLNTNCKCKIIIPHIVLEAEQLHKPKEIFYDTTKTLGSTLQNSQPSI